MENELILGKCVAFCLLIILKETILGFFLVQATLETGDTTSDQARNGYCNRAAHYMDLR